MRERKSDRGRESEIKRHGKRARERATGKDRARETELHGKRE